MEKPIYSVKEEPVLHPDIYLRYEVNRRAVLGLSDQAWLGAAKIQYLAHRGFFIGFIPSAIAIFVFGNAFIAFLSPLLGVTLGAVAETILENRPPAMHPLPANGVLLDGEVIFSRVEKSSDYYTYHYIEYRFVAPVNVVVNGNATALMQQSNRTEPPKPETAVKVWYVSEKEYWLL